MHPGEKVEVESGKDHDGIVGILLVRDNQVGGSIPYEGEVVVTGTDRLEKLGTSGEQRAILDVGVVLLTSISTIAAGEGSKCEDSQDYSSPDDGRCGYSSTNPAKDHNKNRQQKDRSRCRARNYGKFPGGQHHAR